MNVFLWQSDALTLVHRAIRDHFQKGGSVSAFVFALLGIVALLLLLYAASKVQSRAVSHASAINNARRLYQTVLARLQLPQDDQNWLIRLANDLKLTNPSALLISDALFDRSVEQWLAMNPQEQTSPATRPFIHRVKEVLFPKNAQQPR